MPSLRAWGQGSEAPAYLQLVQRPAGIICRWLDCLSKGVEACIADAVRGKVQPSQLRQGPLGHSAREGLHPNVTDLIVVQVELLELWERPLPTWARRER